MAPCKDKPAAGDTIPSKDMEPLPKNIWPTFYKNQFRTTIPLPTKELYPSVAGKCAIITGSNTGLGFEAAKQILSLGLSHLVMGVRSLEKGNAAAEKLRADAPSSRIDVWKLDMESYDSIQSFTRQCESLQSIDIVILNAGLAPMEFQASQTGHEKSVQVNHISTALLAILLLPILKSKSSREEPPRLTIVNSLTAHMCKLPNKDQRPFLTSFDDTTATPWDPQERYGASKLLSQLFLVKLSDYINPDDVIFNMVDPGFTKGTGLGGDAAGFAGFARRAFGALAGRSVPHGAATYADAVAGHGKETHGCQMINCTIFPLAGWYYTDGPALTDAIWSETLQELQFANVEKILTSMKPQL